VPLRRGLLEAAEIDARSAFSRWMRTRRPLLEQIALRGTWLDAEDVTRLLALPLPGLDEVAALLEMTRFASSGRYDLIVIDTAPTGHTLRMLAMPDTLRAVARVFDDMQSKHRIIVETLRGRWVPDDEDALIEQIDRDGLELRSLLRDPARARVSWVTLPEAMAVEETADACAALAAEGIPVAEVIVNRLVPARERDCPSCDRRRALGRKAVEALRRRLPGVVAAVDARRHEPAGPAMLATIGKEISRGAPPTGGPRRAPRAAWRAQVPGRSVAAGAILGEHTRIVLFGGKGGVGKTTCAAAASVSIALNAPTREVMLISTDPAHSLGDAFGCVLSDTPGPVPGAPPNLLVREIDAAAAFRNTRSQYARAIDALFDRLTRGREGIGLDAGHDRRVMQGLVDLAPPGIDELAAVVDATDAIENNPDAVIVLDTAPSGHALRLLEMPVLVQDWAKALMSIVLKYQPVAGVGQLGASLLHLSQGVGRLRALLCDPERATFITVTRAAAIPREETIRLVARLRGLRMSVPLTVVNAVGRGTCRTCRAEAAAEQREIRELRRQLPRDVAIATAPAEVPPPNGARSLRSWRNQWRMR
jgi:arsenite-transporting ATPase